MKKKIALTGASGFVGTALTHWLNQRGYEVIALNRRFYAESAFNRLVTVLDGCEAVINLAGASIQKRWTKNYKQELYNSRISTTRQIVRAMYAMQHPPAVFFSASAVGIYPMNGFHDEYSDELAHDYLATICKDWETEALRVPVGVRVAIFRLGVVLHPQGGAMREMIEMQRMTRVSAIIGSGEQPFAWISLQDVCAAIEYLLSHTDMQGVYNFVSPQCITQRRLAEALSRHYPTFGCVHVPTWVFRLRFGEGVKVLTEGQRVIPKRLTDAGFVFAHPDLEAFFRGKNDNLTSLER